MGAENRWARPVLCAMQRKPIDQTLNRCGYIMKRYGNLSGESGVVGYELGADSIAVEFVDGRTYLYTAASTSADNIATMQRLAKAGRELSTFISRVVKERYARRF